MWNTCKHNYVLWACLTINSKSWWGWKPVSILLLFWQVFVSQLQAIKTVLIEQTWDTVITLKVLNLKLLIEWLTNCLNDRWTERQTDWMTVSLTDWISLFEWQTDEQTDQHMNRWTYSQPAWMNEWLISSVPQGDRPRNYKLRCLESWSFLYRREGWTLVRLTQHHMLAVSLNFEHGVARS